jgi:hypothetical protein
MTRVSIAALGACLIFVVAGCSSSGNSGAQNHPTTGSASHATLAAIGTEVDGALQEGLNSSKSKVGDTFSLLERDTFFHKNPQLNHALIEGHVTAVSPASPLHNATMSVAFDDIRFADGSSMPFHATIISLGDFEPKSHMLRNTGIVIGSAVVGHMIAKHTGNKMGTIAGAAAGVALASSLKTNIVIKPGAIIRLKLTEDLAVGPAPAST